MKASFFCEWKTIYIPSLISDNSLSPFLFFTLILKEWQKHLKLVYTTNKEPLSSLLDDILTLGNNNENTHEAFCECILPVVCGQKEWSQVQPDEGVQSS
jgi:hypothetical protein